MKRRALLVWLVALLAGGTTGCGDSPAGPGPVTPPVEPPPTPTPPPAPPPATPPRLGVTRILAFGDSMTAGTTSAPVPTWAFAIDAGRPESYPFKLQTLLRERYTDQTIEVLNAGHAGAHVRDERERFGGELSATNPNVILLMEGANDLNAPFKPNEGVNDRIQVTVGNLEELVKDATHRQITILVATLPPQRPGALRAGAADFLTRFNDAVKVMANAKGGQIVDVFPGVPLSDIGQDGLHPTESGYQRIAEIFFEALRTRYEIAPALLSSAGVN